MGRGLKIQFEDVSDRRSATYRNTETARTARKSLRWVCFPLPGDPRADGARVIRSRSGQR